MRISIAHSGFYHKIGAAAFFPVRHLRVYNRQEPVFVHARPRQDARALHMERGADQKGVIHPRLRPRFEQKRDVQRRRLSPEAFLPPQEGFLILPDDRVDVILTYDMQVQTSEAMVERPVTETILQNVRVLAIDQVFSQDENGSPTQIGNTATLEVKPSEAELIAHAQRLGTISLSLRPWSDALDTGSRGARTDLLNGGGATGNGVTVFRNGQPSTGIGGS